MFRHSQQPPPFIPAQYHDHPNNYVRQRPNVQEVMQILRTQHNNLYAQLEQAGMNRGIIDYVFSLAVSFTLNQANTNQTASQIYNQFQNRVPWLNFFFRQYNISPNVTQQILTRVIQITLDAIGNGGGQPQPGPNWSEWESLGGILTSGPAAASWQPNRLDVFARGTGDRLYHKWWNGRQWSDWENLGGTLTSSPAAVSWDLTE
ncbi:DUF346 domain-containing protein [Halobacillus shinanisalinarum]|uniref:DUF346 domain-containing protein n=1 Tax=Halobacillus shinanisalinarum TaxID=2932258 RepID=A0ABY4GWM7_9BACI|nr:DUF346 domain-containing protein [Halobacillus shinanisalinarum]UOQ92354.1 DUF346 domain-containing protein [Halobacillus shinanisalinarum]